MQRFKASVLQGVCITEIRCKLPIPQYFIACPHRNGRKNKTKTGHLSVHSEWVGGLAASASKLSTKTEYRYHHCAPERWWRRKYIKCKPYESPNQAKYFRLQETCLEENKIASPRLNIRNSFSSSRSKAETQIPSAIRVTVPWLPNQTPSELQEPETHPSASRKNCNLYIRRQQF